MRNRVSRTILKVSLMALLLSGCAAHSRPATLTVEEVVRKSSQYDGRSISLLACLNVTRHTMTLVDCGMPTTEIAFESTKGKEAGYRSIIDAGFKSLDTDESYVRLQLVGVFTVLEGPYLRYVLRVEDVLSIQHCSATDSH